LLGRTDGSIRPELKPVIDVLLGNEPIPLLHRLDKLAPRRVLAALAEDSGPVPAKSLTG
jgi:hypothetical protein